MAGNKAKSKTQTASKKDRVVVEITPENLLKDGGLFDAVALLCAVYNRKARRPFVRKAIIEGIRQLATMLLAQDNDLQDLHALMDKDAVAEGVGASTVSEFVKPLKRKKAVRRR